MVPYSSLRMHPRRQNPQPVRIAIDTGGTFTDCVWVESGRVRMLKVFSTPSDPSEAIAKALQKIGMSAPVILLHGTTVGTNTLLQRKGARVALVTTAGFEDAIEIGRQARPKLYDFFFDRIEPLVRQELRFGVAERVASDGTILQAPSQKDLNNLLSKLGEAHPESIAISLLFSFANPQNESAVAEACHSLALPISVSHEILPEFREYERTSTVVMNAYLQPVMQKYLENMQRRTQSIVRKSRMFVMQSSGGITAVTSAAREPVRTVLSGPAGGVVGAAAMARRSGFEQIISFDMGGTSTDVALVDRKIRTGSQAEIAGFPVGVPILDIHTVGAGGGSIARFDPAGALRVGPESAGADPGPICYGQGIQPTVTDANLLLGRLQPHAFLGGEFTLDLERTRRITADWLKKQACSLSLEEFAAGVVRVVNANMEKALRVVSIERGYDPRDFTLVAFGGAGGLHAWELAESLEIPRVIIPALPGALSAFGILVSDVVKDFSRTVLFRVAEKIPAERLNLEFVKLRRTGEKSFREEGWRGKISYQHSVDVRYRGQGYELNVPYSRHLIKDFQRQHQRRYGYRYDGREIELVTLHLRAKIASPQTKLTPRSTEQWAATKRQTSRVLFDRKKYNTSVYDREQISTQKKYSGPAIITEYSATTIVPPGTRFWLDKFRNLLISAT
jgi:N-methylhydantoinase A